MNKIKAVFRCLLAIVVILFGTWLAMFFRVNIGNLLLKIFPKQKPIITDWKGLEIGKIYVIKENTNPLRDKTLVELENGAVINLPKGIIDTDVSKIIVVSQGVISVVKKDTSVLTSVFD